MNKTKTRVNNLNKFMILGLLVSSLSGPVFADDKSLKSINLSDSELSLKLPKDSEYKSIFSQEMVNRSTKEFDFSGCYEVLSLDKNGEAIDLSSYSDRFLKVVDGGPFSLMWTWEKIPEVGMIEPVSVVNISKPPLGEFQGIAGSTGLSDGSGTEKRQAVVRKIPNGFQVFHRGDVYSSWSYHYDFVFRFNTETEITVNEDTLNIKWVYLKEVKDTTDPKYDSLGFLYYPYKNKLMKIEKLTLKKLQTSGCK